MYPSAAMPGAPARPARLYYGWPVLRVAAAAMVGTLPGRTQGLGLITEPLIKDLGIGRLLDRFGGRIVLTAVAAALVAGLAPLAWLILRRSPAAIGLSLDGLEDDSVSGRPSDESLAGLPSSEER